MAVARSTTCKVRDMFVSNVTIRCILNATRSLSVPHDPYEADRTVKLDSRSKSKAAPEPVPPSAGGVVRLLQLRDVQGGPLSAGRHGVENCQLSVESTLEGGPRLATGDIGGEVWIFLQ